MSLLVENKKDGVEFASKDSLVLSAEQKEILDLLTKDFLTIKQIAQRRQVSEQAVYKIVKKLRTKGYLTRGFTRGLKNIGEPTIKASERGLIGNIRLHGQQFKIKLLQLSESYQKLIKEKQIIIFESHTVCLYADIITVSCNELKHFYGRSPDEALSISIDYWLGVFFRLQDRLNVVMVKGENTRIVQYNAHYADVGNKLAEICNNEKENIFIYGEDGKAWLKIDKSWDWNELETIHSRLAHKDMQEVVQPFFNDMRDKPHLKLSELSKHIANLVAIKEDTDKQLNELTYGVKAIADYLASELPKKKEDPFQVKLNEGFDYAR